MPLPPALARIESSHRLNAPIVLTAIASVGSDAHDHPPPQWTPGQQMRARVLERDDSGRARVEVGGRQFMMALPAWIRSGDSVELTYLHAQPRIAFALPAAPARSDGPSVALGAAARMISALAGTPDHAGRDIAHPTADTAAGAQAAAPLTDATGMTGSAGALLAPLLRKALAQSGLFYESHQLQWINGQRSLESLLTEPQGQVPAMRGGGHEVAPPPHPDTVPLVRQQLDCLDTGRLAWEGQVWPGQPMRWEIDEPPSEARHEAPGQGRAWRTRLHLQLPGLGAVDAELAFADGAVRVALQAADPARAARLRSALPDLAQALDAAGLPLTGATVRDA
ncbi:MAG TPA: flagellar hook-length control protein FliK [Quisquiliibacterium sp.]|nr:flagellar hook-length control protein FliK [Quisquiliibacterium sp.]